ncbi:MAG: ATP-binding protein [Spirochaetia bacterium]|nr:ATP-binding protein [Spirochaetia bacterium]
MNKANEGLSNVMNRFEISPEILAANERIEKEQEETEKQRRKEQIQEMRKAVLESFPLRFRNSSFDNYELDADKNIREKQEYLIWKLREGVSLIMYGKNGTGKTRLAFASMRDKVLKGQSVKYMTASEFFDEIKLTFNNTIKVSDVLGKYLHYDNLFIDEVDKTYGTVTEFIALFRLIDKRYLDLKPTVLIANATKENVIDVIGRSSYERIVEDGTAILMDWESYRAKNRVNK